MTTIEDRLRRDLPDLAAHLVPAERAAALPPPDATAPSDDAGIDLDLDGGGHHNHRLVALAAAAVLVLLAAAAAVWLGRSSGGDGQVAGPTPTGAAAGVGTWRALPEAPIDRRSFPIAAWSGQELVLWAGSNLARSFAFTDGAAYDPATDSWRRVPTPGWGHPGLSGTWFDGALWVVAKGNATRYDPAAGTWADLPPVEGMFLAALVATDDALWGVGPALRPTGGPTDVAIARYDEATGTWQYGPTFPGNDATAAVFGDPWDAGPPVLWTGSQIVVWNPSGVSPAFDPASDTWAMVDELPVNRQKAVVARAVMTDEGLTALARIDDGGSVSWRVAVRTDAGWEWRGEPLPLGDADPVTLGAAGRWLLVLSPTQPPVAVDVRTGEWTVQTDAPLGALGGPAVVWDGTELFVWGGDTGSTTTDVHALEGAAWTPPST